MVIADCLQLDHCGSSGSVMPCLICLNVVFRLVLDAESVSISIHVSNFKMAELLVLEGYKSVFDHG
jgi:hypothetical protein